MRRCSRRGGEERSLRGEEKARRGEGEEKQG